MILRGEGSHPILNRLQLIGRGLFYVSAPDICEEQVKRVAHVRLKVQTISRALGDLFDFKLLVRDNDNILVEIIRTKKFITHSFEVTSKVTPLLNFGASDRIVRTENIVAENLSQCGGTINHDSTYRGVFPYLLKSLDEVTPNLRARQCLLVRT